jgi:hypothetical protein
MVVIVRLVSLYRGVMACFGACLKDWFVKALKLTLKEGKTLCIGSQYIVAILPFG